MYSSAPWWRSPSLLWLTGMCQLCHGARAVMSARPWCHGTESHAHRLVARKFKRPYFLLHVFANIIITWYSFGGVLHALAAPSKTTLPGSEGPVSQMYLVWIYAIHIYHPIFFKTGKMDWVHHVPVYVLNTLMFSVLSGPVFQFQACVLSGIPGGVDYLLQVFEGQGYLSRSLYKDWASWINIYVRAPFGYISGYVCIVGLFSRLGEATIWQCVVFVGMGVHACWNAPFFCRQVSSRSK